MQKRGGYHCDRDPIPGIARVGSIAWYANEAERWQDIALDRYDTLCEVQDELQLAQASAGDLARQLRMEQQELERAKDLLTIARDLLTNDDETQFSLAYRINAYLTGEDRCQCVTVDIPGLGTDQRCLFCKVSDLEGGV